MKTDVQVIHPLYEDPAVAISRQFTALHKAADNANILADHYLSEWNKARVALDEARREIASLKKDRWLWRSAVAKLAPDAAAYRRCRYIMAGATGLEVQE